MTHGKLCIYGLALIACVGCDRPSVPAANPCPARTVNSDYQRFVPVGPEPQPANVYVVRPEHWFIALDTKTGQICKTAEVTFPKQEVLDRIPQCTSLAAEPDVTRK